MKKTYFPPAFTEKYRSLLNDEWERYFTALCTKIPKTLWINTLKTNPSAVRALLKEKEIKFAPLPFHRNALEIQTPHVRFSSMEEWKNGHFNVQEKAAMLPALVLAPAPDERVLDACAAPGNKTMQCACLMNGSGHIDAVEKNAQRFGFLKHTITKFTLRNVTAYRSDLESFSGNPYDKILLDVPCSSEGFVRKKRDALLHWSEKLVREKALLQKKLLQHAFSLLSPGGELVYSTCTFSVEENEGVIHHLLEKSPSAALLPIDIPGIQTRPGITLKGDADPLLQNCARLYPQDNNSEPFFMARIRRTVP